MGSRRTAARVTLGAISLSSSSHFPLRVYSNRLNPVMLPPGCAKVSTNPRHQLPAVYCLPYFARSGGLIAYGPDTVSPYRRAAGYVDRILKGEKPAGFGI